MSARDVPPMPNQYNVTGTVRDIGSRSLPVAQVELIDFTGDSRTVHLTAGMAFGIAMELMQFYRQVGGGES